MKSGFPLVDQHPVHLAYWLPFKVQGIFTIPKGQIGLQLAEIRKHKTPSTTGHINATYMVSFEDIILPRCPHFKGHHQ